MTPLYILIGIIVLVILIGIGFYNGLVSASMRVKNAWSDIEVQFSLNDALTSSLI